MTKRKTFALDEIGLLELFQIAKARRLMFGTLFVAVFGSALIWGAFQPVLYESRAIFEIGKVGHVEQGRIRPTPIFADTASAIKKRTENLYRDPEALGLTGVREVRVGKNHPIVTIHVRATTPKSAQSGASKILGEIREGQEKLAREYKKMSSMEKIVMERKLRSVVDALKQLEKQVTLIQRKDPGLAAIIEMRRSTDINSRIHLESKLSAFKAAQVLTDNHPPSVHLEPTSEDKPVSPRWNIILFSAAVAGGLIAFFGCFLAEVVSARGRSRA